MSALVEDEMGARRQHRQGVLLLARAACFPFGATAVEVDGCGWRSRNESLSWELMRETHNASGQAFGWRVLLSEYPPSEQQIDLHVTDRTCSAMSENIREAHLAEPMMPCSELESRGTALASAFW